MGLLTLADIQDEVWMAMEKHTDADPSVAGSATRLTRWINQAYLRISLPTAFRHPELQSSQTVTILTSTQSYALDATRWAIDHIRYVDRNRTLKRVSKEALDRFDTTVSGEPSWYARWGNTIYLNRTPGSAQNNHTLTVFTFQIPTALSVAGNTTLLRAVFDEPLVELAAAIGWRRVGDMPRSEAHLITYAALLNDIRTLDSTEGPQESTSIELEGARQDYM